jgi:FkbM family methyltransferase
MSQKFSLANMLGKTCPTIDIVDVGAMALEAEPEYGPIMRNAPYRLIGFEPVQVECDKLNAGKHKHRTYLPYFIGDGRKRTFHLTNFSMTASLYEPRKEFLQLYNNLEELTQVVEKCEVDTKKMDDIPEITNIDFLKIDIQGAEVDAFQGAQRLLKDTLVVWTEVEFVQMYRDQPLYGAVDAELRKAGMMLHTFLPLSGRSMKPLMPGGDQNRKMNQVIWTDAIFIKDVMAIPELSEEKMLKLAVICHDLFSSFDVTQYVLQHYDRKYKHKLWKTYMKRLTNQEPGEPTIS